MTGQRFGMLLVTSYSHTDKHRVSHWNVLCDCGNKKAISRNSLKNGDSRSCGCLNITNLVGQRFGKLEVISYSHTNKHGKACWNTICDCGNNKVVCGGSLTNGHTKGCGCPNIIDMVGKKFGRLLVVSYSHLDSYRCAHWNVVCSCGKNAIISGCSLRAGQTKSCGCLRNELCSERAKAMVGELSPSWNKNRTDEERVADRSYLEYSEWRTKVFERDNFTCQKCAEVGGNLNAHHIEGYSNNIELRTEVSNGKTLCYNCHMDYHHQYGRKNSTSKKFNKWIKS